MVYTLDNLKTQLKHRKQALENEKNLRAYVMSEDFQLAKDYGEQVRANHLRTIANRMGHLERQILELEFKIADME